jgi:acetolactate synthase I/II/III large subunit
MASDAATATRTGGQLLVDALRVHGVDHAFCVPGESFLPVLDALHDARDAIRLLVCRHEGAAANAAEAYGKLTGRPGVCFVTRGPGATHASVGVHTAQQDSTPLVLFVGQVARHMLEREAFQELDVRRVFGTMAKWAAQIDDGARIPELVARAFQTALSGRPGPVVLALPEDVLSELAPAAAAPIAAARPVRAHPGAADVAALRAMLAQAQRPLLLLGGSGWNGEACSNVRRFAEANDLPVACAYRFQDLFDNREERYAGDVGLGVNPRLARRIQDADLLLAIGPRLGEITTSGYRLLSVPRPAQRLVHVHQGADELGRVYQPDLAIVSGMPEMTAALAALPPVAGRPWGAWTRAASADHAEWVARVTVPGRLQMWDVMEALERRLPEDAIVTNGAGNYTLWVHRFHRYARFRTQLAPTSGAMGYGVPAAIAAKAVHPERVVVSFNGDGCFLMYGQELATAVQYGLAIVFLVVNNGMYGTIRMHQERRYPGRPFATELVNPDFAALARAFGARGEVVEETAQFEPALARALAASGPALIELKVDPEAITPSATLAGLREAALRPPHPGRP